MTRFKIGLVLGFVAGWLVATGRAAELFDEARKRIADRGDNSAPATVDGNGVYDFAVWAAQ